MKWISNFVFLTLLLKKKTFLKKRYKKNIIKYSIKKVRNYSFFVWHNYLSFYPSSIQLFHIYYFLPLILFNTKFSNRYISKSDRRKSKFNFSTSHSWLMLEDYFNFSHNSINSFKLVSRCCNYAINIINNHCRKFNQRIKKSKWSILLDIVIIFNTRQWKNIHLKIYNILVCRKLSQSYEKTKNIKISLINKNNSTTNLKIMIFKILKAIFTIKKVSWSYICQLTIDLNDSIIRLLIYSIIKRLL
uniref:Uncharacterized protein n=1 Tax=Amorphochlora amoebiformis TaxID=1561963 RepID=A0A0H5BLR2_9EUKA|nr:hypothetical protein [Amorphochlora amoebiformis]